MNTVSTAASRRRQTNAGQFTRTVLLTEQTKAQIEAGSERIKRGQWVIDGRNGQRGQFIATKKTLRDRFTGGATLQMREYKPGLTFADYQRAV